MGVELSVVLSQGRAEEIEAGRERAARPSCSPTREARVSKSMEQKKDGACTSLSRCSVELIYSIQLKYKLIILVLSTFRKKKAP